MASQLTYPVRRQVASKIEDRLGVQAEIGGLVLGPNAIWLRKVQISSRDARALRVSIRSVKLSMPWFAWLSLSPRSVRGVRVRHAEVLVNIYDPQANAELRHILSRAGRRSASSDDLSSSSAGRWLELEDVQFLLRDTHGDLASVRLQDSHISRFRGRARLTRAVFGRVNGEHIKVSDLYLDVLRGKQGFRIKNASAGELSAQWMGKIGFKQNVTQKTRPSVSAPALVERLLALRQLVPKRKEKGARASNTVAGSVGPRLFGVPFDDNARLSLKKTHVVLMSEQGKQTLLRSLQASAQFSERGRALMLSGSGHTGNQGKLEWNIRWLHESLQLSGSVVVDRVPLGLFSPLLPVLPWYEPEKALLEARVKIHAWGADHLEFEGLLGVDNAGLFSERIAPEPVAGIRLRFVGSGAWKPLSRLLTLRGGYVRVGDVTAMVAGRLGWRSPNYLIDMQAKMAPTPCNAVVGAIPPGLLGEFKEWNMSGMMDGMINLKVDSQTLDDSVLDIDINDHCVFVKTPEALALSRIEAPFMHRVEEPDGRVIEFESGPGSDTWAPIETISPYMVVAVMTHEDGGFQGHHGFSVRSIRDALVHNLKAGYYAKGASTISMQLVKNLFLHRQKMLARKVQEALITWWMEKTLRKREIIEYYLNLIEYGPDVYGIRQAAHYYFGVEPSQITPAQAVYIATMLPNPKLYSSQFRRGALSESWTERIRRILQKMYERNLIDGDALDAGLKELEDFHFVHDMVSN